MIHLVRYFRRFWFILTSRRRRQLCALLILSMISAIAEIANIGALLPFIATLANPKEGLKAFGPIVEPIRQLPDDYILIFLGSIFIIIVFISTAVRSFTIGKQLRLSALIGADIGELVFSSIIKKPFSWHLENNSSSVISRITNDVNTVNAIIQSLLVILVNLFILVLLAGSLIVVSPIMMLLMSFLLTSFYLIVFKSTRESLFTDGRNNMRLFQSSLAVAQGALGGIRDVLLDQTQPYFINSYSSKIQQYRLASASINTKAQIPRYLIEGFTIILIVSSSLILSANGQTIESQLPTLGVLVLGSYRLLQPLQQCFTSFSTIQSGRPSLDRLSSFLIPSPNDLVCSKDVVFPLPQANIPLIELRNVGFNYNSDCPKVIHCLDLSIHVGERIALVGSTGSGKSTLSDILLGLLKPTSGVVLVNGSDLYEGNSFRLAWHRRVAHVPQQIYLSDDSFEENIAFGIDPSHINHEKVRQAASLAKIDQFIETSQFGYSTVVGEQGVKLSGGQRQRIGIARALHKSAEFLVLDEATSSLDNATEAQVMESVDSLDTKITILMIAHRMSTVQKCDRIVHLEQGRIVGIGTYPDLLANSAAFRSLVNSGEQNLA